MLEDGENLAMTHNEIKNALKCLRDCAGPSIYGKAGFYKGVYWRDFAFFTAWSSEVLYDLVFFVKSCVKNRITNATFCIFDGPVILVTNENDLL